MGIAATATPEPADLFIMTTSTLYGWKKALFAALGNIVGLLALGLVAITGLGAMLHASVALFNIVRYIGAAYLVYLGIRLILSKNTTIPVINGQCHTKSISSQKLFF